MNICGYKAIMIAGKEKEAEELLTSKEQEIRAKYFETGKVMNVNVFSFQRDLYVYIEFCNEKILPEEIFSGIEDFLSPWPDGDNRYFYPLTDIFHPNQPQSTEHWKRKSKPLYCSGRIAKIIPEFAARYIFYHYQLQEERPGDGGKYWRIFLMGDTAFFYAETPDVIEKALHEGALLTNNTPEGEAWQRIMGTHFRWWDEDHPVFTAEYDWEKNGYPLDCVDNQWLFIKNILSIV